jgi:hypothetical protein
MWLSLDEYLDLKSKDRIDASLDDIEEPSDQKSKKKKKAKKVQKAVVEVAFEDEIDDAAEQTRFRRGSTKDLDKSQNDDSFVQKLGATARSSRLSLLAEEEEKSSD